MTKIIEERWQCPRGHYVEGNYCTMHGTVRSADSPTIQVETEREPDYGRPVTQEPFIELIPNRPERPLRELGRVKATVTSKIAFLPTRKTEDADRKLRRVAAKMGADAVINLTYNRGLSATSWKALAVSGIAVRWTS